MIAIALLAAAFLPLLELQSRFVQSVEAIERADERAYQRDLAFAYLSKINPDREPIGDVQLGDIRVQWRSEQVQPARPVREEDGYPGRFTVSLYKVTALTQRINVPLEPSFDFEMTVMGWTATQPIADTL